MGNKVDLMAINERYRRAIPEVPTPATYEILKAIADSASDVPLLVARVEELEKESEARFRSMVDLKTKLAVAIESLEQIAFFHGLDRVAAAKLALEKLGYIGSFKASDPMTATEVAARQIGAPNGPKAPPDREDGLIAEHARKILLLLNACDVIKLPPHVHLDGKQPHECICPTCGLRHGDAGGGKAEF